MQKLSKNHRTPWCSLSRWGKTNAIWLLWKSAMCAKTLICSLFQNTFHRLYSQDDGMGVMAEYLTEGESIVSYAPFHSWGVSIIEIWLNKRWWPVHAGPRMEQACCNYTSPWYWYRGSISFNSFEHWGHICLYLLKLLFPQSKLERFFSGHCKPPSSKYTSNGRNQDTES